MHRQRGHQTRIAQSSICERGYFRELGDSSGQLSALQNLRAEKKRSANVHTPVALENFVPLS
jgi:hypothetical protein